MTESYKLTTILFADIAGYTSLMQESEPQALDLLNHFKKAITYYIEQFDGEIVQYYGDGCLMAFRSSTKGVASAIELQKQFIKQDIPVRIGIHIGEVLFKENNAFGDGVNVASRIESIAVPGSILMSKAVRDLVKNKEQFRLLDLGEFHFKNVTEEIRVYAVDIEGLEVPDSKKIQGKLAAKAPKNSLISRALLIAAVVAAVILLAQVVMNQSSLQGGAGELSEENRKTLAVLPIVNLNSQDENVGYFADGVTNELIDELAQLQSLQITAFLSSMRYKDSDLDPIQLAEALGVDYLLAGTSRIYDRGDSVKISLELLEPKANQSRLWSGNFSEKMEEAPHLQLAIARQVAQSLDLELSDEEEKLLTSTNTENGEAFRQFLYARSEILKLNKEGFRNSIEATRMAIELDPGYSQAYTFLAWIYQLSSNPWFDGHFDRSNQELDSLVDPVIKKSLELDPKSSDIYLVRAHKNVFVDGLLQDGKADVDYALEVNSWPLVPTTYCICIVVSTYIGLNDVDNALRLAQVARKYDPGNVFIYWDEANALMLQDEFEEAQRWYDRAARAVPVSMFKTFKGWNYYHLGQYQEALESLEKTYSESEFPVVLNVAYLSNTHHKLGNSEKSEQYRRELISRMENGENNIHQALAMIYAAREEYDLALDQLEKALEVREFTLVPMSTLDPIFRPLHENQRFISIRKQLQFYGKEAAL